MWKKGINPGESFDMSSSSPALIKLIEDNIIPNGRCLVPGCGRGYDLVVLAANGERSILGIDLSPIAVDTANNYLIAQNLNKDIAEVKEINFFELNEEEKFDFIYDYTFLCALDPSLRKKWANKMSSLLKPNGMLITLIFPIAEEWLGGPPFKVSLEIIKDLLEGVDMKYSKLEILPKELCHKGRDGEFNERWNMKMYSGIGIWTKK